MGGSVKSTHRCMSGKTPVGTWPHICGAIDRVLASGICVEVQDCIQNTVEFHDIQ